MQKIQQKKNNLNHIKKGEHIVERERKKRKLFAQNTKIVEIKREKKKKTLHTSKTKS